MIYLDNAATTFPKPPEVINAVNDILTNHGGNPGRGGHFFSRICGDKIFECRENMAKLIKADNPENIIFTKNATEAINLAIKGVVSRGDEIIISSMEHNSVLRSAVNMEKIGVTVKIAKADLSGYVSPQEIELLITDKTKMICVIHASNIVGTVNPIKEISHLARKHNIITLIDCAQTGGILPINAADFDMLAFAGHKGLYGPFGTGILYIRNGLNIDTLIEGGTGSFSESALMPLSSPDRYEAGTVNACGIAGLNEGIKFVLRENVYEKEKELSKRLKELLFNIKGIHVLGKNDVGVFGILFDNKDCVEAARILDEKYGIASRAGLHCAPMAHRTLGTISKGLLRLSVGYFNTIEDIERAALALEKIILYN
ncbi:MAG: aminotransferase class V-fold PLP-dependent enzyme [Clostridia bacterium]|nr:aminotransferase class V-fold PLP-dependent enzyme [Clostridia bacterium]